MLVLIGIVPRWPAAADFAAQAPHVLEGETSHMQDEPPTSPSKHSPKVLTQAAAVPTELPLFAVEARIAPPTFRLPQEAKNPPDSPVVSPPPA